jgi:hypothetical protein
LAPYLAETLSGSRALLGGHDDVQQTWNQLGRLVGSIPRVRQRSGDFTQRGQGPARTAILLHAMARGLYALAAFCLALALLLPHANVGVAFAIAIAIACSLSAQWLTRA